MPADELDASMAIPRRRTLSPRLAFDDQEVERDFCACLFASSFRLSITMMLLLIPVLSAIDVLAASVMPPLAVCRYMMSNAADQARAHLIFSRLLAAAASFIACVNVLTSLDLLDTSSTWRPFEPPSSRDALPIVVTVCMLIMFAFHTIAMPFEHRAAALAPLALLALNPQQLSEAHAVLAFALLCGEIIGYYMQRLIRGTFAQAARA